MQIYQRKGEEPDVRIIADKLFRDGQDPRNINYRRVLVRPKLKWGKGLLLVLGLALLEIGLFFLLGNTGISYAWRTIAHIALALFYILLNMKRIVCGMVHLYQRFAPESLRMRCRFEPSCSQYMLLSIEKYGFWRGFINGFRRLTHCNINGGGYDWP